MAVYSISDLEKLSGIKAHTLRVWEQRYGIITPKRTTTNIRYYTDEDLRNLMNIALLNKSGFKISKISDMTVAEIAKQVAQIAERSAGSDTQVDALTIAMIDLDEYKFEKVIGQHLAQNGLEYTMLHVINPFLEKLGLLWLTGSVTPVHEHFISALIKRKIIASIDRLDSHFELDAPIFLLYLPESETQELSLLFMHYLVQSRGGRVIYLGQGVGLSDLRSLSMTKQPQYIFTLLSESLPKMSVQTYIERLAEIFPQSTLLLTGYQVVVNLSSTQPNWNILESLPHTIEFLNKNLKNA